jgi:hypothetical protein
MISVRASRTFTGNAPISLVGLARLERRPFPVSVREMATVESREFTGAITAGDVDCSYRVTLYNSGRWFITADFTDNGDILGDSFLLEFPIEGQNRGLRLDHGGEVLGPGRTLRLNDDGLDEVIRDDWARIRSAALTAKLSASPDIATLVSTILAVVTVIGIVTFFAQGGPVAAGPCDGQPPDDHGQCVQFRHVSGGADDPGSSTLTG